MVVLRKPFAVTLQISIVVKFDVRGFFKTDDVKIFFKVILLFLWFFKA